MIKLGVNSVLFKTVDFKTAAKAIRRCGFDGVEISGIQGLCEHLNLDTWKNDKRTLKAISEEYELPFLSTEIASLDKETWENMSEDEFTEHFDGTGLARTGLSKLKNNALG